MDECLKPRTLWLPCSSPLRQVEPPTDILLSVDVPSVDSIHFHSIKPSSNHDPASANANPKFPLGNIPVTFQLDDIQTNFVNVSINMFISPRTSVLC